MLKNTFFVLFFCLKIKSFKKKVRRFPPTNPFTHAGSPFH